MSERLVPRLPIELQIQVVQNASADQLRSLSLVSKAFWGKAAPRLWCQISGASVIALMTEFHIKQEFEERWDIRDNFESHREAMPAEIDIKQIKRFQTVYAPLIRKLIIGDSTILNKQVLKYLVERATDTQATPLLPNLEVLLILATNLKPEVTGHIAPWSDNEHGLPLNGPNLFYSDLEDLTLLFLSPSVHTLAAYCDSHGAITPHRILELAPNLRNLRIEFHTYPDRYGHRPKTLSLCYQALPESLAEVWHTGIDKRYSEFSWPRGIAENLLLWTQLSSLTLHCQFFERLTIFTLARLPLLTNLVLLGAFDRYDWQNHDSEADKFCALRNLTLQGADASTVHKFFRCTSLMQLLETVYWAPADDVCGLGRGLAADNYRDVIVDLVGAVPGLKRLGLNIRDRAVFEGLGLANDLAGLLDLSSLHIDNHPTNHDLAIPFLLVAGVNLRSLHLTMSFSLHHLRQLAKTYPNLSVLRISLTKEEMEGLLQKCVVMTDNLNGATVSTPNKQPIALSLWFPPEYLSKYNFGLRRAGLDTSLKNLIGTVRSIWPNVKFDKVYGLTMGSACVRDRLLELSASWFD